MAESALVSSHFRLYRYWAEKRGTRPAPTRRDLDPADIGGLLRRIALIDGRRGEYRWRLMGTAVAADIGRDLTGRRFGENITQPSLFRTLALAFDQVLAWHQALFMESICANQFGNSQAISQLLLPLSADEGTPAMVILTWIARHSENDKIASESANAWRCCTHPVRSVEDLKRDAARWESAARQCEQIEPSLSKQITRVANLWGPNAIPFAIRD